MRINISFPTDDNGYFDRKCSFDACQREFKVCGDDWKDKVSDEIVYCPWCRHEAPSDKWFTDAQLKHMHAQVEHHAHKFIVGKLKRIADDFNYPPHRNSLISMRLELKSSAARRMVPCAVATIMEQRFDCKNCSCRFASIGASFFCPACGQDSVSAAFKATVETVRSSVTDAIAVLDQTLDRDAAANLGRLVTESALVRLVATHQRHAEAVFSRAYGFAVTIPKNVFQRLGDASVMWKVQTGSGYEDILKAEELDRLRLFFQRRHLLEHRDGLVDVEYVAKSNDKVWSPGQRLVITPDDVLELARLVEKLAEGIEALPQPSNSGVL